MIANPRGLIFAYAGGTHSIFFKLRRDQFDEARKEGWRFDPTYGEDWIELSVGRRWDVAADWQEAMRLWAHDAGLNLFTVN